MSVFSLKIRKAFRQIPRCKKGYALKLVFYNIFKIKRLDMNF